MKALLVSEYYLPHWTGIVKGFAAIAKKLHNDGHSVSVLTVQYDKTLDSQEQIDGIAVYRSPFLFKVSRTYYSFSLIVKAVSMYRDIDTIVINSPNSNILPLTLLAKLMGKQVIIFHQGDLTLPRKTGNQVFNRLLEVLFDFLTIPAMTLADRVSTYTQDYTQNSRVMKYFMYKFFSFIPPFTLSSQKPDSTFSKKLATLKKNYVLIGFAGRFVEEKGFDILFKAIPHVLEKIPSAIFVFAGENTISYEPFFESQQRLFETVKKNVIFLGLLGQAELTAFYKSLDVFVVSSRSDCFPLTQIEAVQAKVPIVVTNIPGARMIIKSSGFGEIADPEDYYTLSQAIIKVAKNPKKYQPHFPKAIQFLKSYDTFKTD